MRISYVVTYKVKLQVQVFVNRKIDMQQPTDSLTAVTNPDTVYITTVQGQSSGNVSDVCVAVKTLVKYENVIPKE